MKVRGDHAKFHRKKSGEPPLEWKEVCVCYSYTSIVERNDPFGSIIGSDGVCRATETVGNGCGVSAADANNSDIYEKVRTYSSWVFDTVSKRVSSDIASCRGIREVVNRHTGAGGCIIRSHCAV